MNYQETLDYLYSQLPMFQRIGAAAFKKDLTNTVYLSEMTGNPHRSFASVHIAGTNGKGSVTHMIAAALQASGLKVGVYCSPHLKDFRERIKINGELMEEAAVIQFVEKYKDHFEKIKPSFFEITVAMAFDYFAQKEVNIAVIETGMGGRLDSTNIITPILSVITNISLEHQQYLGDTIEAIAGEKAGIIKNEVPVVIGESNTESSPVFKKIAHEKDAPIYFADDQLTSIVNKITLDHLDLNVYHGEKLFYPTLKINTGAAYQQLNVITALKSIELLQGLGYEITEDHIYEAFATYKELTNFRGRWEILGKDPFILADTAHNPAGLKYVFEQLADHDFNDKHIVLGMVKDKDVATAINFLPADAIVYCCKPDVPRGLDEEELLKYVSAEGLKAKAYPSVKEAYIAAKEAAKKNDLIYIGGSTFVVAEVL